MSECEYCTNRATRSTGNPWTDELDDVCEIHYSYMKPNSANVNPVNIDRCCRCGHKATDGEGKKQRLHQHHINYPLDVTVPVCDKCHQQIHSGEDPKYLERYERTESPYSPRGSEMATGIALADEYRHDGRRNLDEECPNCGTELIWAVSEMGMEKAYLCPNNNCYETELGRLEV